MAWCMGFVGSNKSIFKARLDIFPVEGHFLRFSRLSASVVADLFPLPFSWCLLFTRVLLEASYQPLTLMWMGADLLWCLWQFVCVYCGHVTEETCTAWIQLHWCMLQNSAPCSSVYWHVSSRPGGKSTTARDWLAAIRWQNSCQQY